MMLLTGGVSEMGALITCEDCGFVTRRGSQIGARGRCPDCEGPLEPVSFPAARRMLLLKQARMKAAPSPSSDANPVARDAQGRPQ